MQPMASRPKDRAMSAEEYRAWRRKGEEALLESNRALREKLDRVRSLIDDGPRREVEDDDG